MSDLSSVSLKRCWTELFHACSLEYFHGCIAPKTQRLVPRIVQSNSFFSVIGQETCEQSKKASFPGREGSGYFKDLWGGLD